MAKKLKHAEVDRGGKKHAKNLKQENSFVNALCKNSDLTFDTTTESLCFGLSGASTFKQRTDVVLKMCSNTQTLHNLLMKP